MNHKKTNKTLEEVYDNFNKSNEYLIKKTNGFLDLTKYPNVSEMAKYVFYNKSKSIKNW